MRLAQIMLGKGFGGAERSFVDLTRALLARGHEVLAIGERRGVALDRLAPHPGLRCAALTCLGPWDRIAGFRIGRLLAAYRPALVQAHLARAAHLGGRAARRLRVPTVAKTHDKVDLAYYRNIDVLVPTTREQADYLHAAGRAGAAVHRIPNFSALAPVATLPLPPPGPPRLVALGRFVPKKGFDLLLEAAAILAAQGRQFSLSLAGAGPERVRLVGAAARLGLGDRFSLCGWVDEVQDFLSGATLFVLPSRDEPFGIVVLEAMACGIGIVSTPTAGPSEVLDSQTALLAADISAPALAAGIAQALDDPQATAARAARALARYRAEYTVDAVVTRYEALYRGLVADRV